MRGPDASWKPIPPRRYGTPSSFGFPAVAKSASAYSKKVLQRGRIKEGMREGIAVLESPARDYAARPDRGAPGPQAQEPGRLGRCAGSLACLPAEGGPGHRRLPQESKR